ncbi:uncharacterized protein LOC131891849 [Tigriopus californicus]|nr:uncharacterized protein LOC131891849 [Tigriopus californicus]
MDDFDDYPEGSQEIDLHEDPEPKRSDTCSVCLTKSENFHLNYGAPTCLSCRAFFRRAVTGQKIQPCLMNGTCAMTPKSRGDCRFCRFQKCLFVGMKPEQVMNESTKKARFKKMFHKGASKITEKAVEKPKAKRGRPKKHRHSEPPAAAPTFNVEPVATITKTSLSPFKHAPPVPSAFTYQPRFSPQITPSSPPIGPPPPPSAAQSVSAMPPLRPPETDERVLRTQLVELLKIWRTTTQDLNLSKEITESLQTKVQTNIPIQSSDFKTHLDWTSMVMRLYARYIHDFNLLTSYDQDLLLKRNQNMLSALIFAKAVQESSSFTQKLEFINFGMDFWREDGLASGNNTPSPDVLGPTFLDCVYLSQPQIPSLVQNVNNYEISPHWYCVIVYGSLFYSDSTSAHLFNDPDHIRNFSTHASKFGKLLGWDEGGFLPFLSNLRKLSDLLQNVDWSNPINRALSLQFSEVEDMNINNVVEQVIGRIRKVNIGSDMLTEIIMVNLDVPLSKNFACQGKFLWGKKSQVVLEHFEEYRNLPTKAKTFVHTESLGLILGLIAFWHASIFSPMDQFKLSLGHKDLEQFEIMAKNEALNWKPRHVSVREIYPMECPQVAQCIDALEENFRQLREFTKDVDGNTFYLMFLFLLFEPCTTRKDLQMDPISGLSRKFEYMLIRRSKLKPEDVQRCVVGIKVIAKGIDDAIKCLKQP